MRGHESWYGASSTQRYQVSQVLGDGSVDAQGTSTLTFTIECSMVVPAAIVL